MTYHRFVQCLAQNGCSFKEGHAAENPDIPIVEVSSWGNIFPVQLNHSFEHAQMRAVFSYSEFIIKTQDDQKTGVALGNFGELENEWNVWREYQENPTLPILRKICFLKRGEQYFLVEPRLEQFNEAEWQAAGYLEQLEKLKNNVDQHYVVDSKAPNFVRDPTSGEMFLIDICTVTMLPATQ